MKKGIESLKASIMKDCVEGNNCFNENGCNHEYTQMLPQDNKGLLAMGIKEKCVRVSKCFHQYCNKYKWILDRAKHYSEKTGKTVEEVLEIWETDRGYWYMNYYQDNNMPLLNSENIIDYEDWINELKERFGEDSKKWAFKCPTCGNVQTVQDFIDNGVENPENKAYFSCIGRYAKGKGCDWTLGGLFQNNKISVMKNAQVFPVFEMAEHVLA